MKQTSLNLTLAFPEHIHVETDIEAPASGDYDVSSELEIGQNAHQPHLWRVCVDASFAGKAGTKAAHSGRVRYVGFFSVNEDVPADKMGRIIAVTAPSILYSSIRELVALLTGRGPGLCVLLPIVTFLDNLPPIAPQPRVATDGVSGETVRAPPTKRAPSGRKRKKRAVTK